MNLNEQCLKCGQSLRRMMLTAMIIDAGGKTRDPSKCHDGNDHEFPPLTTEPSQP